MTKKEKLFDVICKLNVKYWHLPFGRTDLWDKNDREILEKAIKLFHRLDVANTNS